MHLVSEDACSVAGAHADPCDEADASPQMVAPQDGLGVRLGEGARGGLTGGTSRIAIMSETQALGASPTATPGAGPTRATVRTPAPQSGFAPWKDPSKSPIVRFENIVKRFGDFVAVKECTLDIYEREFFALLGPSGCGKTTLLRMLAGFEKPTSGRILVAGEDITELAPYERPVNMMFQSYALFPHMTVEQNIGFGLKQEGMPKDAIAARVEEAMAMLELSRFGKRKPHQLSGGQQQRVALARAIAKKPRICLLYTSRSRPALCDRR